jgi:glycosyltransferase involved in cell wall biosynthesis
MSPLRVLVLANDCNPDWPSLPVVGYKYARALADHCEVTVATQVRNRTNIEAAGPTRARFCYIDTEYLAAPIYKVSRYLRGGDQVAWSTNMLMNYVPYIEFERQVLKRFRNELRAGEFDLIHRITPMSPTLPSYIAGRTKQPFVLGPLNGNLAWPSTFLKEKRREREGLRKVRGLYKSLPFARNTFREADCVLAAFQHTIDDLSLADPARVVPMPEIGFDAEVFYPGEARAPYDTNRRCRFLYAGRLVPYKVPEAAVRAFATSDMLARHHLSIVGEGPERPRLEAIVAEHNAGERITFAGRLSQAAVAEEMRASDCFVFPSIRELGAGVVIEAMASKMILLVTDYGAPGDLCAGGRGVRVPLQPLERLTHGFQVAMENVVADPMTHLKMASTGEQYARTLYSWSAKAAMTVDIYKTVLAGGPLDGFRDYV